MFLTLSESEAKKLEQRNVAQPPSLKRPKLGSAAAAASSAMRASAATSGELCVFFVPKQTEKLTVVTRPESDLVSVFEFDGQSVHPEGLRHADKLESIVKYLRRSVFWLLERVLKLTAAACSTARARSLLAGDLRYIADR